MSANLKRSLSRRDLLGLSPRAGAAVQIGNVCLAFNQVACESCADICEAGAIQFNRVGAIRRPIVYADVCTACEACLEVCPVGALQIHRP